MDNKKLAILDFDNTLFDWVHIWHITFSAMMSEVERISGIGLDQIATEIREVFQKYETSEYAFVLSEVPTLVDFCGSRIPKEVFSEAIIAFRKARTKNLQLYPGVADALLKIKGKGARIAIYTESQSYYSFYRLKRLGLDGVVDVIYHPHDHDVPSSIRSGEDRFYNSDFYSLRFAQQRHTPLGELKPNRDILRSIIDEFGIKPDEVVYIGDSLHKDIAMAEDANVDCAWAKYGVAQDTTGYDLLKRVTHWSDDDVLREAQIRARSVSPKITLGRSLMELFDHFKFVDFHS